MKKRLLITMVTMAAMLSFSGCEKQYEVANYQGEIQEDELKSDYNKELFYRNDKKVEGADPFVFDNTQVDGYYYMYVTYGTCFCYRSTNMIDWEPVGNALANRDYKSDGSITEVRRATWSDIWACEVVWDEDTQTYYMFFSATPQADETVQENSVVERGTAKYQLMVATSKYAYKDFKVVNFKDAKSCGEDNLHAYNSNKYPHYYAKYLFLNPEVYAEQTKANGLTEMETGGYVCAIDPHPYVDEDGTKYLFWVDNVGDNSIWGVKMDNWLKPDWSTAKIVAHSRYYTVADWKAAQNGETVDTVSYELSTNEVNEGPVITKHNGKYYLTFSVNQYIDSSYQVGQAVADSPLGEYRKLSEEEGGVLISGSVSGSQDVSGTGHHSFVTLGEQTYMVYHRHDDFVKVGTARNPAMDEVKWIAIKDKNGSDLDVMYVNGPTCTVQPKPEIYSDYKNIAAEAKVTGTDDVSYLTDDLLSIYKYGNAVFMENIAETTIKETTTFSFEFDDVRPIRAIMVYNSKIENTTFQNIKNIELVCEENGEEIVRYIENMKFSPEYFKANDYDGTVYYTTPGAAAYTEFDELKVKSLKITVEVPEGQEAVGISEVKILGK